jgi:pyruvate-ferredoxin/flavodoxin oxidoreductase
VRAFQEAESYHGPSLIIAYSPCIAHGYDLALGADQQKLAVDSGYWPLYRYDPRRADAGENALQLDAGPPRADLSQFVRGEARFRMVENQDPKRARALLDAARQDIRRRVTMYEQLAHLTMPAAAAKDGNGGAKKGGE